MVDTPGVNLMPSNWFMERDDGVQPLVVGHVILAFLLCLVGLCLALTVFAMESIYCKFIKKKSARIHTNSDSEESVELANREREDTVMSLVEL